MKKPDPKAPVPDAPLSDAVRKVKDIYRLDAKRKPEEVLAPAKTLLKDGLDAQDMPDIRYALLREARDQADRVGVWANLELALQAAAELAKSFQVDPGEMRMQTLKAAVRANQEPVPYAQAQIAAFALAAEDDAEEADDYETAGRLVRIAQAAAPLPTNKLLEVAANLLGSEVVGLRQDYEAVKPSAAALAVKPDDADAVLALGRIYCFTKGDWDRGPPLLARGSDPKLKELVQADIAAPVDPEEQDKLADTDKAAADAAWGAAKARLLGRAFRWCELAEQRLTGFPLEEIKSKMAKMPNNGKTRPIVLYAMWGADNGWIDATARVRGLLAGSKDRWATTRPSDLGSLTHPELGSQMIPSSDTTVSRMIPSPVRPGGGMRIMPSPETPPGTCLIPKGSRGASGNDFQGFVYVVPLAADRGVTGDGSWRTSRSIGMRVPAPRGDGAVPADGPAASGRAARPASDPDADVAGLNAARHDIRTQPNHTIRTRTPEWRNRN